MCPKMPASESKLPPGPPLPAVVQSALYFRWPYAFARSCQRRYGDVFTIRSALIGKAIYVADPDLAATVFAHDGIDGHAGEINQLMEPVLGPRSLLLLDRDDHLRERRMLTPAFHGAAIDRFERLAREAARREVGSWSAADVLVARPAMQRITFEVICRAVLGIDDPHARRHFLAAFEPIMSIPPLLIIPRLRVDLGRWSPWARFQAAVRRLDAIVYELIGARRDGQPREDILGLLLQATDADGAALTDRHIRDELVTLLVAGHETTATALSWALERLARHPEVVAAYADAPPERKPAWLDAIAAETLRVRPIIMDVGRRLSAPLALGDYVAPAGAAVLPGIFLVQADEQHHADACAFDPRRFLDQPPARQTWLPFGGGRRRCIGAALAQMELRIVLGTVLDAFQPLPVSSKPERPRVRGITFAPDRGGRVRLAPAAGQPSHLPPLALAV
jgi:cytochrome P450 family 135